MPFPPVAVRNFRKRYIVFRVHGKRLTRKEIISLINRRGREYGVRITLTVFEGDRGIVLVSHLLKDRAIEAMNFESDGISVETIKTSGTIKKAKKIMEKY